MTRYFCHECSHEGSDFATSRDGFVCPRCGGAFVEEIPNNEGMADDPREFDPVDEDEDGDVPFGFFGSGQGGAAGNNNNNNANNGNFFHYESPGGGFTFTGGFGGATAAGQQQQHPGASNPLAYSLMQAFGLAPAAQGPQAAAAAAAAAAGNQAGGEGRPQARRWQSAGANDPANRPQAQRNQVPIQNLATFLNDAFGGPHPADDPDNNPFAEGGHEAGPDPEEAEAGHHVPQHPLGALFSLFGHVLGGGNGGGFGLPTHANAGDYVWGSEANFQQLLNDLMEQAAGRAGPQPAPDDMIEKLPRLKINQQVLDMDSITTCGVCLDAFQLEDAAVALPCKHLYHEDCLVPWLKTSGTCPICRYALVPQPGQPGYGEEGQQQAQSAGGTASSESQTAPSTCTSTTTAGTSLHSASSSSSASASSATPGNPPRPPLSTRPSTAQIPDVEGGSTLPGSWVWPSGPSDQRTPSAQNDLALGGGGGEEDDAHGHQDADPDATPMPAPRATFAVDMGTEGGDDQARSAARAAAEAAERRRATEAEEARKRQQAATPVPEEEATAPNAAAGSSAAPEQDDMPIIEDVD
ncbi:hypothetical protein JCM10908_003765 [Rhodotorula pacifica]|uniref:uncharacterized protein n=1 Tax=Rhodotorula pacifica TaxID=1495444 RepID=UPI0031801B47